MIAEGTFKARGITVALLESSVKKTPYYEVVFNVTEGPEKGNHATWQGWVSEKARVRTAEGLETCGYDGTDPKTISKNEVWIVVEHEEEYQGNKRARVKWINSLERSPAAPLEASRAADIAADIRGLILAKKQAGAGGGTEFPFGAEATKAAPKF